MSGASGRIPAACGTTTVKAWPTRSWQDPVSSWLSAWEGSSWGSSPSATTGESDADEILPASFNVFLFFWWEGLCRIVIYAVSIVIFSSCTIAMGAAQDVWTLVALRFGVAIG